MKHFSDRFEGRLNCSKLETRDLEQFSDSLKKEIKDFAYYRNLLGTLHQLSINLKAPRIVLISKL